VLVGQVLWMNEGEYSTSYHEADEDWARGSDSYDSDDDPVDPKTGVPAAPRYYDWKDEFPFLQMVLDNYDTIAEEMMGLANSRWFSWPENKLYSSFDQNGDWKVVPFMHTFPAFVPGNTRWIENNCDAAPNTISLLKKIPGLRTVLFSRLGPKTRLSSHQGWDDLANFVLRCHLPLKMPDEKKFRNSCGMVVEGEIKYHQPRDFLVFDDSKFHRAFNAADEDRVVLIFDIIRPVKYPKGFATRGHTEQLDQFIDQYENMIEQLL